MTLSYSRYFLIAAFILFACAFTPLVTQAGGGGSGVRTNNTDSSLMFAQPDTNQAAVCPADAKMCPDGSFVGRVGRACQFAACPTGTSTPPAATSTQRMCPPDAKMCPNGSFVVRTGPSCNFAACPVGTSTPPSGTYESPGSIGGEQYNFMKWCQTSTTLTATQRTLCQRHGYISGSTSSNTVTPIFDGTVSSSGTICPQDAKMCADGSFVSRTGPSCTFAACPNGTTPPPATSTQRMCPPDAKMCPDGSFVGRAGASCQFTACPAVGPDIPQPPINTPPGSSWNWPFIGIPGSSSDSAGAITGSTVLNTVTNFAGAVAPMMGPAFNALSVAAMEFGAGAFSGGPDSVANYTNFGALTMPTFSGGTVSNTRSTSTLQTLLDSIWNRGTSTPTGTPGAIDGSILGGGGTKPNKTNTIAMEVKVTGANGSVVNNWSTSTTMSVPQGGQLHFRWTASDYTQCLPFLNDNGRYALQVNNRTMTIGNTETEDYDVPEITATYKIECGGQKNGEMGVDHRTVRVTGAGTIPPPLFGGDVMDGGTVSNTDPSGISPVACTMDAKICPDGSSVGRVAPSCEFAPCTGGPLPPPVDLSTINTYEKCVAAGFPVQEMNPPRCVLPDGRVFTQTAVSGGVCTQDAKMCPDGSSVGRVGPSCEFAACPNPR